MTILATHFAIVLGAWRLRVRIDIDEPREEHLAEAPEKPAGGVDAPVAHHPAMESPRFAPWGRG